MPCVSECKENKHEMNFTPNKHELKFNRGNFPKGKREREER